ncbi:MAG: hypothetical protein K2G52_07840 [Muribaculaceae bacterium]|nr:hypothetical protein [Muribaculaceae bacterium]
MESSVLVVGVEAGVGHVDCEDVSLGVETSVAVESVPCHHAPVELPVGHLCVTLVPREGVRAVGASKNLTGDPQCRKERPPVAHRVRVLPVLYPVAVVAQAERDVESVGGEGVKWDVEGHRSGRQSRSRHRDGAQTRGVRVLRPYVDARVVHLYHRPADGTVCPAGRCVRHDVFFQQRVSRRNSGAGICGKRAARQSACGCRREDGHRYRYVKELKVGFHDAGMMFGK